MPGLGRRGRVRAHKEPMLLAPAKPVLVPKAPEKKSKKEEPQMKRFNFRSSVTGRFVTALFAKLFPWLTVKERR